MSAHDKLSSLDKISISELSRKKQVEFVDYNLTKDIINLLKQSYQLHCFEDEDLEMPIITEKNSRDE